MKRTAIAALFFLMACVAHADNEAAGWRVGGGLAYGDFKRDDGLIDDSTMGYKLFAQYRFNSWIGAEGAYYDSGDFSGDTTFGAEGGEADIFYHGFSIDAIGYIPVPSDRVDLFLKAGYVAFTNVELTVDGNDAGSTDEDGLTYGLGISIRATDKVGIRVEFDWYDTNAAELWSINIGAEYRF